MENNIIRFPNLGIEVHPGISVSIGGVTIAFYAIAIMIGMVAGALLAFHEAKRTNQNVEDYIDFTLYTIIAAIVGARLYYVAFEWGYYSKNPIEIITGIRDGGLAIYGGIIASVLTLYLFTRIRHLSFSLMADTACLGLVVGQIIGRWGNFFNREAFGGYTNNLFAMMLPVSEARGLTNDLLNNTILYNGQSYIQVHPTFLYEGAWNLLLLLCLLLFRKHKKRDGEVFAFYLLGYGIGRMWIEGLRTDQLLIWNTSVPVSQLLSFLIVMGASVYLVISRIRLHQDKKEQLLNENNRNRVIHMGQVTTFHEKTQKDKDKGPF